MNEQDKLEIERLFGKRDGPIEVDPPKPKPYLSCKNCNYYHRSMASTGGQRGAPTYYKSCTHPEAWEEGSGLRSSHRSLVDGFGRAQPEHQKLVTPQWCPFLRNKEEETK